MHAYQSHWLCAFHGSGAQRYSHQMNRVKSPRRWRMCHLIQNIFREKGLTNLCLSMHNILFVSSCTLDQGFSSMSSKRIPQANYCLTVLKISPYCDKKNNTIDWISFWIIYRGRKAFADTKKLYIKFMDVSLS